MYQRELVAFAASLGLGEGLGSAIKREKHVVSKRTIEVYKHRAVRKTRKKQAAKSRKRNRK
jgi:hypothetical protein